jgi:hypothetical protein
MIYHSFFLLACFDCFCEFFTNCLWYCLNCLKTLVQHLVCVFCESLESHVHHALWRMWYTITNKFNIRMTWKYNSQHIPQCMIFIIKDISSTAWVILLLAIKTNLPFELKSSISFLAQCLHFLLRMMNLQTASVIHLHLTYFSQSLTFQLSSY